MFRSWTRRSAIALFLVTVVMAGSPAYAQPPEPPDPGDDPPVGCLGKVTGWLRANPDPVMVGHPTTISWSVNNVPTGCPVTQRISGPGLVRTTRSGAEVIVPTANFNEYALYELTAYANGRSVPVANLSLRIDPRSSTAYGRKTVWIDHDWEVGAFVRAIGVPNTTVILANHVNLDLSGRHTLHIAPGVHILGGRSSTTPGPRIFTTTKPEVLFIAGEYHNADGVRISGIRLDGGNMGIGGDGDGSIGIRVGSSVNVEIGNNEIYGWSGIAVQVMDGRANRIGLDNATAVRVHDNYIHHNRHWRELGYGVQANESAYVLIERNVFDFNRHAIEASNTDGIGYLAHENLLLTGGGENCCLGEAVLYTHQFDVHGTDDGWSCVQRPWGYYCGDAGEYFDYRYNTLWYMNGGGIKVRGEPDIRTDAVRNVFANDDSSTALEQTDGDNLAARDNRFGVVESFKNDACDFDRDGQPDDFIATGATWWFRGATGQLHYLHNSSQQDLRRMTFSQVDGDGRCDIEVDGVVHSGGRAASLVRGAEAEARHTDLLWQPAAGGDASLWVLDGSLNGNAQEMTVDAPDGARLVATGDFNADGAADAVWRNAAGDVSIHLLDQTGGTIAPVAGRSTHKGSMPATTVVAGVGDFNADRRADILWRHSDGQLELWFAGEKGNSALVTWMNVTGANGEPIRLPVPLDWLVKGVGDFNGDGYSDILWRSVTGHVSIWYMHHAMHVAEANPGGTPNLDWQIQSVGDFDGDGYADTLWRYKDGGLAIWFRGLMEYAQAFPTKGNTGAHQTLEWQVAGVGDFTADGRSDILWRHSTGPVKIWAMDGGWHLGESPDLAMSNDRQLRGLAPQAAQRLDLA